LVSGTNDLQNGCAQVLSMSQYLIIAKSHTKEKMMLCEEKGGTIEKT